MAEMKMTAEQVKEVKEGIERIGELLRYFIGTSVERERLSQERALCLDALPDLLADHDSLLKENAALREQIASRSCLHAAALELAEADAAWRDAAIVLRDADKTDAATIHRLSHDYVDALRVRDAASDAYRAIKAGDHIGDANKMVGDVNPNDRTIDDGLGNVFAKCDRPDCGLEIVRPGKVQCWCDSQGGPLVRGEPEGGRQG